MNAPDPQPTLREWRRQFLARPTLVSLAAATAVLTLAGPFGTDDRLSLVERGAYWAAVVFLSYAAGLWANIFAGRRVAARGARILASGLLCSMIVLAIVVTINLIAFGFWPSARAWVAYGGTIVVISLIVNTAIAFLLDADAGVAEATQPEPGPEGPAVPLLDRLPLDKRGPLVPLSVEDHYVRVRTAKGEELLLMRLSDAIREVGRVEGAQVHRSHWAAWSEVTAARREGDRAMLTMSHGPEIPVSRANLARIKEAGLLPR